MSTGVASSSITPELLLDTHALLWWLAEPNRLSPAAHAAIAEPANKVYVVFPRL